MIRVRLKASLQKTPRGGSGPKRLFGFECTIGVDDIDAAAAPAVACQWRNDHLSEVRDPDSGLDRQNSGSGRQHHVHEASAGAFRGVGSQEKKTRSEIDCQR